MLKLVVDELTLRVIEDTLTLRLVAWILLLRLVDVPEIVKMNVEATLEAGLAEKTLMSVLVASALEPRLVGGTFVLAMIEDEAELDELMTELDAVTEAGTTTTELADGGVPGG
ncbi:hypothetical protein LTR16_001683 [Cryomyces antarcticus]|uniref:Uncharacterized protein n=1 Tax=Cryomyces antarcticus TaxID=329879 RepID=A0ABR0LQC0_9PEZI|nr:hypothetical protein LTR39_001298 [Cryomyces antarcticus]KAK5201732.1 hypothetical protein LTR16_001683 [Cryomyces antarcticus]